MSVRIYNRRSYRIDHKRCGRNDLSENVGQHVTMNQLYIALLNSLAKPQQKVSCLCYTHPIHLSVAFRGIPCQKVARSNVNNDTHTFSSVTTCEKYSGHIKLL